jgi:hypothetical protein
VTSTQNFNISQTSTGGGAQSIQVKHSSTQSETANRDQRLTVREWRLTGHITQSSTGVSTAKIRQTHNITQKALGPNVDQTAIDPM